MGVKLFVSGEIAYAADVNEFLMEQSIAKFATVAARNTAFGDGTPIAQGGDGKPLLKEGQFCYLEDNSLASNGSGTPEVQFYNGTTWVGAENFAVSDGEITDVKVNAAAAIQLSKLASGTTGQIIVCNSSGVPSYVTLSGDGTISNTGVLTIGANNVALGTDTTGDYVASLVAGTGITLTNNSGESASPTIEIGQDVASSANPTFAGVTSGSIRVGITGDNEINTTSGNLFLDSTGGTVAIDDILSVSGSAAISSNLSVSGSVSVTGNIVSHAIPEAAASLTNAIDGKIVKVSSGVSLTTTGGSWTNGTQFTIINTAATAITITASTGTTFLAAPLNGSNVKLRAQYSTATFIYEQGTGWYVIGDLTSS